jgi:DNA-nicking Smr family endonuclease
MARRGKPLSPEDRALWGKVARTVRPLPDRMERLMSSSTAAEPTVGADAAEERRSTKPDPEAQGLMKAMRQALATSWKGTPDSLAGNRSEPARSGMRPGAIEKPVHRKIARGRVPLEARIDLHGHGQDEAHGMLLDFLRRVRDDGARHVLVITGKGSSLGSEGALRRAVPHWLSKPEFAKLVSGYDLAARGHGGEGALYVRLKRKRGTER